MLYFKVKEQIVKYCEFSHVSMCRYFGKNDWKDINKMLAVIICD